MEDKLKSAPSFKAAGLAVNWTSKPGPPSRSSSRKLQGDSKPEGQEGEGGSAPLSPSRYAESFFRTGSNSGVSRTSSLLSRTSSTGRASPRDPTHGDVLASLAPIADEEPHSATAAEAEASASGASGLRPAFPARSDSMSQAFAAYAAPPPISVKVPDPVLPLRPLSPPKDARGAGARVKTAVEPRPLPREWAGWNADGKMTELAMRLALIEAKVHQVDEGIDYICDALQQLAGQWHHRQWREHDRRTSEQFASLQARLDQHFAALEQKQEALAVGLQARQDAMFQQLEATRKEAAQAQDTEHKRAWADQHSRQDMHFASLQEHVDGHLDIIKASFDSKLDAVKAAHAEESRTVRQYLHEVKGKSTEVVEGQVGLENSTRAQFKQTTDTLEMMMKQMMEELRQSVINLRRTVRRH